MGVVSDTGPGSRVLGGSGVSGGPGSRSGLRIGWRRAVVLRIDLPAGAQVLGTCRRCRSDLPGLG